MQTFRPSSYGSPSPSASTDIPVGPQELYLVSYSGPSEGDEELVTANSNPVYRRSWFWPVVAFGVALGAVRSWNEK